MLWLLVPFLAFQAPDEVKVSSRPYVPQSGYTLRVDTKIVEIAAVVRDSHGKVVDGLSKDDFRISDEGKPRVIDHFSIENTAASSAGNARTAAAEKSEEPANGPRFLALFIDDVNGKDEALGADLKRTQTAAEKFVKEALKSGAQIAIFTTSGEPKLDFTRDQSKLIADIAAIKPHIRIHESGLTLCPRITPYLAYRIAYERDGDAMRSVLYDSGMKNCPVMPQGVLAQAEDTWRMVKQITADSLASVENIVNYLGTKPGKREMIMASSGFIAVSMQEQKDQVIEKALRLGVVISALDSKGIFGEEPAGLRPEDPVGFDPTRGRAAQEQWKYQTAETPLRIDTLNEPIWNIAEGTGGVFFHNNNDLAAGFRKLGTPPEIIYRFSFQPDGVADGAYHKLKITAKGYKVQTRPGYFAPKPASESREAKLDREVSADDTVADFPIGISVENGKSELTVMVSVDISKLRFDRQGDRQNQKVVLVSALVDGQGKIVAAKEGVMQFALTDETFKRLTATGVNARITLQAPPGAYRLRQVAEEALDGKIACSTHPIEIH